MANETIETIARHRGGHLRVVGPPASGKTTALLERFRSLSDDGHSPAVVAFSRSQRERALARLFPTRSARMGRFPVYTYHQIALEIVAAANPAARRPLGDMEERVVLSRLLRSLEGELCSDFTSIVRSDALHRSLLSVFHVLQQSGVDESAVKDARARERGRSTSDILMIFARFQQELRDKGLSTYYQVAGRAARLLAADPTLDPLGECDELLIDDFQDVDAGQFCLVEALAPVAGERRVSAFGDPTGARFGYRGTSARFLREDFVDRYQPDDVRLDCAIARHDLLGGVVSALLEQTGAGEFAGDREPAPATDGLPLFQSQPGAGGATPASPAVVTMTVAEDEIAEAQRVAGAAAALVAEGKCSPGDIAVVARDRARYALSLSLACHDHGVPFDTGDAGRHAMETLVQALLGLMGSWFEERLAETVASSPFYDALRGALADELELGERRPERDIRELRRVVAFVKGRCTDKKAGTFSMQRFLDACVRPVVERTPGLADEAVASVARLLDEWSAYESMIQHVGGRPAVDEFRAHHNAATATASMERDPRCVAFYTAREAATHSFPVVFVVGCADGLFPAMDARESYIPYDELTSLFSGSVSGFVGFHEARDRERKLADEHALMLSALTRARDRLHLSAPLKVHGEAVSAPARALLPLTRENDPVAERIDGPRLRAAMAVAAAGPGYDTANVDMPSQRVARAWLAARPVPPAFAIEPFALSPSRLSTYVQCPRRLFYSRVLGIEEERTIHLTIGSLFHDVLDDVGKELPTRDELVAKLTPERIAAFVDARIRSSRDLGPEGSLLESVTRFHLEHMVSHVRALEKHRVDDYRIETEAPGDFDRGGWKFVGRMDRVDSWGGRPRVVIDYKTTSSNSPSSVHKTGKTIREYMVGAKGASANRYWQVPMYSFGARGAAGDYPELFCYYVVPPGEDPYASGVFISDDKDRCKTAKFFEAATQRKFASVAPGEVDAVMDEVVTRCTELFAERDAFDKTDDTSHCRSCYFNRVCDRRVE